jgi:ribonuclease HII
MDEEAREAAFALLTSTKGVLYAISVVDNRRIDEINILQVTGTCVHIHIHIYLCMLVRFWRC